MSIKQTNPHEGSKRSGFVRLVGIILTIAMLIGIISSVGVITGIAATTETFTDENGISWTVTECYPGWAIKPTNNSGLSGSIDIPTSYKGKVILVIDSSAFYSNKNITSVNIPNSIVSVGSSAFERCSNLQSVHLPDNLNHLGSWCFSECSRLSDINFNDFKGNRISTAVFYGCSSLASIEIPPSVEELNSICFQRSGIIEIDIPATVKVLGGGAFQECSKLERVTMHEGLERVENGPFIACPKLKSLDYPSSATVVSYTTESPMTTWEITENGITWVLSLYNNKLGIKPKDKSQVKGDVIMPWIYPAVYIDYIEPSAFEGCSELRSIRLPSFCKHIGSRAFANTSLEEVYIPDTVSQIDDSAFCWNSNLKSITLPSSLEKTPGGMCTNCSSLETIEFNDNLKEIGFNSFAYCRNLNNVEFPSSLVKIGENAFESCYSYKDITIPNSVKCVNQYAFSNIGEINSLSVDVDSLSYINGFAFYKDTIDKLVLGDNVKNIDTPLLSGNSDLEYLTLGKDVGVNNDFAFLGDTKLTIKTYKENLSVRGYTADNRIPVVLLNKHVATFSGDSAESEVILDTDTPNLRVTVPSVLPISVDSDNNVTVADNAQINNMCRGQVDITSAELNTSTWSLVDFDTDFKTVPVDTKQYGFKLYNDDVSDGIDANIFSTINGGESLLLSYDGNVAIQSEARTAEEIGNIVFTVAWHRG